MSPVVVLAVSRPDFHLAVKFLRWAARLAKKAGPADAYQLVVYGTQALTPENWNLLKDAADRLPWVVFQPTPELFEQGYAASANYTFRTALEFVEKTYPGFPMLWVEADCVPMRPTWVSEIAAEYAACGKPFLGDLVEHSKNTIGAIDHLTGNAVYSPNWRELAPALTLLPGPNLQQGWDSSCAFQIVPQSAKAKTIQQIWRPPYITDGWAQKFIRPTTALFHQCKDGSLIDVLTQRAGETAIPLGVPLCGSTYPAHVAAMNPLAPTTPRVAILYVTFARDIEFLRYSLMACKKYAHGFSGITVVVPEHELPLFTWAGKFARVLTFKEPKGKGMLAHEAEKCRADIWCPDAEVILHLDADCLPFRPMTPNDFAKDWKCLSVREPYSRIKNPNRHIWRECVMNATGLRPDFDYMVRHPQVHPRAVYAATRAMVEDYTGKDFYEYMISGRNEFPQEVCEFNMISAVGEFRMPDAYNYVEYDHAADAAYCGQPEGSFQFVYRRDAQHITEFWSHGGIASYKADCDAVLAGRTPAYWVK